MVDFNLIIWYTKNTFLDYIFKEVFYIIYNILNSIDNNLENFNSKYVNSPLDNFINNLKTNLNELKSLEILNKLPKDTEFIVDRFEGNFAVCEQINSNNFFNIPKSKLKNNIKPGDVIYLKGDFYTVNQELTKKNYEKSKKLLNGLYKS